MSVAKSNNKGYKNKIKGEMHMVGKLKNVCYCTKKGGELGTELGGAIGGMIGSFGGFLVGMLS